MLDEKDNFMRDEIEHHKTKKTQKTRILRLCEFSNVQFNLTSHESNLNPCGLNLTSNGLNLVSRKVSNESLK